MKDTRIEVEKMKVHTNVIQEKNSELQSQLDMTQKKLQKLETNSELLQKRKIELKLQLEKVQKQVEYYSKDMKKNVKFLQEELKSQFILKEEHLQNTKVKIERYFNKYTEFKDKSRRNIAIQANTVCTYVVNQGDMLDS